MSAIGIDFGNQSCYIAVARGAGAETIVNDYSLRATPSCVAFDERMRTFGVTAADLKEGNLNNTFFGFKRLLGKKLKGEIYQQELQHLTYDLKIHHNNSIVIPVSNKTGDYKFTSEQVTAMLLGHLKILTETALGKGEHKYVVSVPCYFGNNERLALLNAGKIAGIQITLLDDTKATALAYFVRKEDVLNETPRNVVFVDFGFSNLQVSIVEFTKSTIKIKAITVDPCLGGRDIDKRLAEYLCTIFAKKYRNQDMADIRQVPRRAYVRLINAAEKVKKQMSVNTTKLQVSVDNFCGQDVTETIERLQMEELCQDLFNRVNEKIKQCLNDSAMSKENINSVELVGGSVRIPAVKNLVKEFFGKQPSTTLNQDEAVAEGCALQSASFIEEEGQLNKKGEGRFSINDNHGSCLELTWRKGDDSTNVAKIICFDNSLPTNWRSPLLPITGPFSAQVCMSRNKEVYVNFEIPKVPEDTENVFVKGCIDRNGILKVLTVNACVRVLCKSENQQQQDQRHEAMEWETDNISEANKFNSNQTKTIHANVDINQKALGLNEALINESIQYENELAELDKQENERIAAKNALEEFIYKQQEKVQEMIKTQKKCNADFEQSSDFKTHLDNVMKWMEDPTDFTSTADLESTITAIEDWWTKINGQAETSTQSETGQFLQQQLQLQQQNRSDISSGASNLAKQQQQLPEPQRKQQNFNDKAGSKGSHAKRQEIEQQHMEQSYSDITRNYPGQPKLEQQHKTHHLSGGVGGTSYFPGQPQLDQQHKTHHLSGGVGGTSYFPGQPQLDQQHKTHHLSGGVGGTRDYPGQPKLEQQHKTHHHSGGVGGTRDYPGQPKLEQQHKTHHHSGRAGGTSYFPGQPQLDQQYKTHHHSGRAGGTSYYPGQPQLDQQYKTHHHSGRAGGTSYYPGQPQLDQQHKTHHHSGRAGGTSYFPGQPQLDQQYKTHHHSGGVSGTSKFPGQPWEEK